MAGNQLQTGGDWGLKPTYSPFILVSWNTPVAADDSNESLAREDMFLFG